MKKYIHYCWFGDKPFPKLGQKCLESWKRYLPDYEIIKWSEENVDLNECPFIKEAYENKKWAFVADYARAKALKEYGGIYFDTDMEVIKNIDHLFKGNTFLGIEDTGYVAVGVWYEKEANGILPTKLLNVYQSMKKFDMDNISKLAIPILLSGVLKDFGLKEKTEGIQLLKNDIYIYPREYFYPYSYDRTNNVFTDNTCMIHYYDASWIPLKERIEVGMVRRIGKKKTFKILEIYRKIKDIIRKIARVILFPITIHRSNQRKRAKITTEYIKRIEETKENINKLSAKNEDYIVFHNKTFLGVTSATEELFNNRVDCGELYRKEDVKVIAEAILNGNFKLLIFSSLSEGQKELIKYVKKENPKIKIKTYWHGNHSQILDHYGWKRNKEIIDLHKKNMIDVMGTCKKSLIEFYKKEDYNPFFITNKVTVNVKPEKKKDDKIRIGLYAAKCDDWRKNMFTQMAAVALIDNVVLDMVPLNDSAKEFAEILGLKLEGEENPLKREDLIARMSKNTVNLYVTFSECSPMLPLESFEMNVPCITGNNHHYFKDSKLEKYLVVNNEESPLEIKEKIELCMKEKENILKLYKEFREKNMKEATKEVTEFLQRGDK